ncbi:MAG: flagellar L-ring protein [Firmicutes bacterium]|nr:flagellar L-ring protein [Bacillota bacterium]
MRITGKAASCLLICFVICLFGAVQAPSAASAESLWNDAASANSLYADHKAHAVGDILTIVISESSSATRAGTAKNTKDTSIGMDAGTGIFHGIASASSASSDSFKTSGSLANTSSVTGKITVQVTEVLSNGLMAVTGTQSIKQNGEEQKITITGLVRPEDISAGNIVMSYNVANAQMRVEGKGPIAGKQRQGIITQILNILF